MNNPLTIQQWNVVRKFAMRSILELEDDLIENPDEFGPEGVKAANEDLDEVRAAVRIMDNGCIRLVLDSASGKAAA